MSAATVVFVGPSIALDEARAALPAATFRPPVRFGDVALAVQEGFRTLVLLDGVFEQVPAIWHKEILLALARGVRVIGASSMGALRAAELDTFGMQGVGWVYEQYRAGLEDDDEVALVHGDAECGFVNLTVPLVQLRYVAHRFGQDAPVGALLGHLAEAARPLFYRERTITALERLLAALTPDRALAAQALALVHAPEHQVKRLDALRALRVAAAAPAAPVAPARPLDYTVFLQRLQRSVLDHGHNFQGRQALAHALARCDADPECVPVPTASAHKRLQQWQRHKQLLSKDAVKAYLLGRKLDEPALFAFIRAYERLTADAAQAAPEQRRRADEFLKLL